VTTLQQRIQDLKDISIAIDSWDDVFSDFDPRPLAERTLSEDFVQELKKRYHEGRKGMLSVTICAPAALKDERTEHLVSARVKEWFSMRAAQIHHEIRRERARGVVFLLCGFVCLTMLTLLGLSRLFAQPWAEFVEIALMPLGWFGMWEGVAKLVDIDRMTLQERTLYRRLAHAGYHFRYLSEAG
jgi:hypothetical protein